jgi:hypothetical protein
MGFKFWHICTFPALVIMYDTWGCREPLQRLVLFVPYREGQITSAHLRFSFDNGFFFK